VIVRFPDFRPLFLPLPPHPFSLQGDCEDACDCGLPSSGFGHKPSVQFSVSKKPPKFIEGAFRKLSSTSPWSSRLGEVVGDDHAASFFLIFCEGLAAGTGPGTTYVLDDDDVESNEFGALPHALSVESVWVTSSAAG